VEHQRHEERRGDEAVAEERQCRQQLDRVLDHHEREAPDRRDADERQLGEPSHVRARPYGHIRRSGHSGQRGARAMQVRLPWRINRTWTS
jgi:hypothetical protein